MNGGVPAATPARPLRVGIAAGEHSGDTLGAAFIRALRAHLPDAEVFGVAGPKMVAAGCTPWVGIEALSVMGLAEVLRDLPRLLRLRRELVHRFLAAGIDVFVGIDSPEFNLRVAAPLKSAGIPTVQYVSPQVWAWRQGRVKTIGRAIDLILCLLPFETDFYARHGVRAEFVGHPLADEIPLQSDRAAARGALGLDPAGLVIALLPGSRLAEVAYLAAPFVQAAARIRRTRPDARFIAPMASAAAAEAFAREAAQVTDAPEIHRLDGRAQEALAAADGVIVASGTATLETLLTGRPMVVAYRMSPVTAFLLRALGMVKVRYFSQPNLLAGRALVPEFLQEQVRGAALGEALLNELQEPKRVAELQQEFTAIHRQLRVGGAERAVQAVLELLGRVPPVSPGDAHTAGL
ncbi:MAG: lipid-A-disaccharide synthase [Proteobacteria bacterium]|nr:lipid-A-disaccharide synthase [Pseudomonadota bacterium]